MRGGGGGRAASQEIASCVIEVAEKSDDLYTPELFGRHKMPPQLTNRVN